MLYKPDLDAARQRMQAFWAHDCIGRPALQIVARSEGYRPRDDGEVDLLTRKTDVEYILNAIEETFRSHCYLAEAVPVYVPGLVCSDAAAYLNENIDIHEDTVSSSR